MMQYSSLFSAGLFTQDHIRYQRSTTPTPQGPVVIPSTPPKSPRASSQNRPVIRIDTQQLSPARPKLRKRRSSMTVGASPMAAIKSPNRTAGMSFRSALLMSPSKDVGPQSFMKRLRSGSIGTALRSRRRQVPMQPAKAPPTAPLPALPNTSHSHPPSSPTRPAFDCFAFTPLTAASPIIPDSRRNSSSTSCSTNSAFPRPGGQRRVLGDSTVHSSHYANGTVASPNPTYLTPDFATKLSIAMPPSASSSPLERDSYFDTIMAEQDEEMKEN
ncbi:hypothetical protein BD410DRAFT_825756 [Rickenella mellea]|uniref:Uncharacterized protein n=1 Tax=Rickenella mellea TaxID=50990 RepID=A0A4Y7QG51_9AGAM|nr:hypothetical protein BD410DRAFT_825756 [Rickenella mellea]